jgi:hypothetical protein
MNDSTIGGFFGLEVCSGTAPPWTTHAQGFVSGRAAIAAMLVARGRGAIWIPHYICGAVRQGVAAAGRPVREYVLMEDFGPPDDLPLTGADTLVAVDYFGLTGKAVDRAIRQYGSDRVLVDASQSMFFPADSARHIVYSPRKFAGLPDGGLLVSADVAAPVGETDERSSMTRMKHLIARTAGYRDEARGDFRDAEASLVFTKAVPMSELTRFLLSRVDFETMAPIRRQNAECLFVFQPDRHPILSSASPNAVPMCAPVVARDTARIRATLARSGMFLAHYWADAVLPAADRHARLLLEETLFLPCDQRYTPNDMQRLNSMLAQARTSP